MTNRERCLRWILDGATVRRDLWSGEGSRFTNLPSDRGGPTRWGCTWRTINLAITRGFVPPGTTAKTLTREQAEAIYASPMFFPAHGDELPPAIALAVFDGGVNSGPHAAAKWLQRALSGSVDVDGVIGRKTVNAVQAAPKVQLLQQLRKEREKHLRNLIANDPSQVANERGWWHRLDALDAECRDVIAEGERA